MAYRGLCDRLAVSARRDLAIPAEWLVGPLAGLVLALVVGRELWKAHQAADQRERDRTDALEKRLAEVVDILKRAKPR